MPALQHSSTCTFWPLLRSQFFSPLVPLTQGLLTACRDNLESLGPCEFAGHTGCSAIRAVHKLVTHWSHETQSGFPGRVSAAMAQLVLCGTTLGSSAPHSAFRAQRRLPQVPSCLHQSGLLSIFCPWQTCSRSLAMLHAQSTRVCNSSCCPGMMAYVGRQLRVANAPAHIMIACIASCDYCGSRSTELIQCLWLVPCRSQPRSQHFSGDQLACSP